MVTKRNIVLCLAIWCVLLVLELSWYVLFEADSLWKIAGACLVPQLAVASLVFFDFFSKCAPDTNYPWMTLIFLHLNKWSTWLVNRSKLSKFHEATKSFNALQAKTLRELLLDSEGTQYGKDKGLTHQMTREELVKQHKLTKYADYESYVEKIFQGEEKILVQDRPKAICLTSGTTGKQTYFPITERCLEKYAIEPVQICNACRLDEFPGMWQLGKVLGLYFRKFVKETEGGIPLGPISATMDNLKPEFNFTSPKEAQELPSGPDGMYVHLLFGLHDKHIIAIEGIFSFGLYTAMKVLEQKCHLLVKDVRNGTINRELNVPNEKLQFLESKLTQNPKRADEIEAELEKGFVGIIQRLWPRCCVIQVIDTGSMELYGDALKDIYCKGIPFYNRLYGATEGFCGINIWPRRAEREYVLLPEAIFYEFIPVDDAGEDQPKTLFSDQLQVGECYELVPSNRSGCFRYRFGDVVKVTRFYNEAPVIQYMYRQGQVLNIVNEKVSEDAILRSVRRMKDHWGKKTMVDYSCTISLLIDNKVNEALTEPYYVMFVEFKEDVTTKAVNDDQMDRVLQEEEQTYLTARDAKLRYIPSGFQVFSVKQGTFRALSEHIIASTTLNSSQFKMPRVLKKKEHVQFMMDRVKL
ncbi:unnamed protein product [Owenia fusiformis]|uniref:Uncharacterized protein n=1 Tax=Owenia fusiformis TaxID=6347 RepID=A0A8J1UAM6_OWEFU|nr:unnamed protein product [Owenia fusiformis]